MLILYFGNHYSSSYTENSRIVYQSRTYFILGNFGGNRDRWVIYLLRHKIFSCKKIHIILNCLNLGDD